MIEILAVLIASIGAFFILTSVIGMYKFKSLGSQIHAASISDSCGIPLCLFALSLLQPNWENIIKIWLMIILVLLLSPLNGHALMNAAWKNEEELKK